MKFQLDIQVPEASVALEYGDTIILLGSCFSDTLAPKFSKAGFEVLSNPFGTIFHPLALARILTDAIDERRDVVAVQREDLWFDWRASGALYGITKAALEQQINAALDALKTKLKEAKLLVVTFGTAWGYHLNEGELVANCHKMPQQLFDKKITALEEMVSTWATLLERLKILNPKLEVVFTVSPVRHAKYGLVENNRSKARLIELCAFFEKKVHYFPSYEIVVDVLREYRFYTSDLVHPNDVAIEYVWEQAMHFFLEPKTKETASQVISVNQMRAHQTLYPESNAAKEFARKTQSKKEALTQKFPKIFWV